MRSVTIFPLVLLFLVEQLKPYIEQGKHRKAKQL
jgi:hypothetical protein